MYLTDESSSPNVRLFGSNEQHYSLYLHVRAGCAVNFYCFFYFYFKLILGLIIWEIRVASLQLTEEEKYVAESSHTCQCCLHSGSLDLRVCSLRLLLLLLPVLTW